MSRHQPPIVNLPNAVTLARLLLAFACIALLEIVTDSGRGVALVWAAFALFVLAAGTDFLDGYLARSRNQVTALGRVADPFVDKVLVCGVMISLLHHPEAARCMPSWVVVVVVTREFLVTTLRGLVEAKGHKFPADRLGKLKMVAQCITVGALLTLAAGTATFETVAALGVWITLLLTVVSMFTYLAKAWPHLRES